jgi:hypothetical protein
LFLAARRFTPGGFCLRHSGILAPLDGYDGSSGGTGKPAVAYGAARSHARAAFYALDRPGAVIGIIWHVRWRTWWSKQLTLAKSLTTLKLGHSEILLRTRQYPRGLIRGRDTPRRTPGADRRESATGSGWSHTRDGCGGNDRLTIRSHLQRDLLVVTRVPHKSRR